MKKAMSAPLCSAFVIPGLGQILNQDLVRGLAFLASVFILLVSAAVKFFLILRAATHAPRGASGTEAGFVERFISSDFTMIWIVAGLFGLIWLASVVDAFLRGRRIDDLEKNGSKGAS